MTLSITIDIDWAPDVLIQSIVDVLYKENIKATFFITHETKVDYKNFELAAHPNFLTQDSPESIISNIKSIVPGAKGIRSHSLVSSARLQDLFVKNGFTYSSNFFLDSKDYIEPSPYLGILEIPIYFIDNLFVDRYQNTKEKFNFSSIDLKSPGVKSFLFHPTNIFLNLENMERHELAKPIWKDANKLNEIRNTEAYGVENIFKELIRHIKNNKVPTYTLNEIAQQYEHLV